MRLLITALGSSGDVNPLIAIGLALQARAHQVAMLVNPYFKDQVIQFGLEYRPLGEPIDLRMIADRPELMRGRTALLQTLDHLVIPNIPVTIEAIESGIRGWRPTLVLGGHTSHGARWACERSGVPYAGAVLTPMLWLSRHDPIVLSRHEPQSPGRRYLSVRSYLAKLAIHWIADRRFNRIRRENEFPPEHNIYVSDVRGGVINLGLWSRHFRPPLPDDPPQGRICGFPWFDRHPQIEDSMGEIEAYLRDGDPPIVFTLGTAAVHVAGSFYHHAAQACRILGRRGVLLTRHREYAPGDLSPNVRAFTYAPFSFLLPRGCATVHHGGVGTTAQAMRAGRPTVIVPFSHDQFDNAARAKRLGVSATVWREKLTPQALADALVSVIDCPDVLDRARRLGELLAAEDGALEAAKALEETVQRG